MHERNVVVRCNAVAKRTKTLLHALYGHCIGKTVANVLKFLVCRGVGDQEAIFVAYCDTADKAATRNRAPHDRNVVCKLCLEDTEKVLGSIDASEAIRIGQFGKDADLVTAFAVSSCKLNSIDGETPRSPQMNVL